MKPEATHYPSYYGAYIAKVKQNDVVAALEEARREALGIIGGIPPEMENHAYAHGKWSVKEVFLHVVDTERVFSYRALSFARGETQKLPPFDENLYTANCNAQMRSLSSIVEEYEAVSTATLLLFRSFPEQILATTGEMASGKVTVNALGFIIAGHMLHHLGIIRERYLNK